MLSTVKLNMPIIYGMMDIYQSHINEFAEVITSKYTMIHKIKLYLGCSYRRSSTKVVEENILFV